MILKYIPQVINFYPVPEWKYKNCSTREEYKMERSNRNTESAPLSNGGIRIDPTWIGYDYENELFAGDWIVGAVQNDGGIAICLYQWKECNPKRIIAYALIKEWEQDSMDEDGIQIIKPVDPNSKRYPLWICS